MASQGYWDWLAAGKPYTLIRPAKALQRNLRAHGLTVYDYPDQSHLEASTPQDHTPFSVTGWPGPNARWKARGLDIMPRDGTASGRKENADIARRLIRDRDAGVPGVMWIKYLNWTDEAGVCRQERWMTAGQPLHRETRSSTDRDHIHISGRSDVDDDARAEDYDPLASGGLMATATAIIERWAEGFPTTPDGKTIEPVKWRVADEAFQRRVEAALAVSAQRETDALAAIKALAAGGTNADTAAILARIDQRSADVTGRIAALEAELDEARERLARALAGDDPAGS